MDECPNCDETLKISGRIASYQLREIKGLQELALRLHKSGCEGHVVITCEEWIREQAYELSKQIENEGKL